MSVCEGVKSDMLQLIASFIISTWEHCCTFPLWNTVPCGWSTVTFKSSKMENIQIGPKHNMHTISGCQAFPLLRQDSEVISQSQLIQMIREPAHVCWCSANTPLCNQLGHPTQSALIEVSWPADSFHFLCLTFYCLKQKIFICNKCFDVLCMHLFTVPIIVLRFCVFLTPLPSYCVLNSSSSQFNVGLIYRWQRIILTGCLLALKAADCYQIQQRWLVAQNKMFNQIIATAVYQFLDYILDSVDAQTFLSRNISRMSWGPALNSTMLTCLSRHRKGQFCSTGFLLLW